MYSAGLSPCPRHSPRGLDPPSSVTPTARTTAIIFQLVLLRGGVWVGGEGAVGAGVVSGLGARALCNGLHTWSSERACPVTRV